jgi:hypothetical protein
LELSDLQFEFGRENRGGRHGTPPVWISAFARYDGDGGWSRHSPDDTPSGFVPQLESLAWLEVCRLPCADGMFADMAVTVEVHHTGDPETRAEVVAVIEHVLADRAGDWLVSIIGSQANDGWQMKIAGPNGFERSYTLEGTAGEHRPEVIRVIVGKMVAANI